MLAAARAAGVRRFIAQSFAGWPYARAGGPIKTEEDPLDSEPPAAFRRTLEAIRYLESAVTRETGLEGLVLRYGAFYGRGTAIGHDGWMVNDICKRRVPVIGGGGVWSFTHVDDAARFTRAAIERGAPGVYNIVDDDPARVSQWLPALAEALGAKPPSLGRPFHDRRRHHVHDRCAGRLERQGQASLRLEFDLAELAGWISKGPRRSAAGIVARYSVQAASRMGGSRLGLRLSPAHNGPVQQRGSLHPQINRVPGSRSPDPQ